MKSISLISKKVVLLLSVLAFVSCEDRIQMDLDSKKNKITVDAFLNNLPGGQKIRLTSTDNYLSGTTPPPIVGAQVTVTDLTTNKIYEFADQQDGNYLYGDQSSDSLVVPGHSYQLKIIYHSYEYTAITEAKRSPSIEMLFFNYEEASESLMGNSEAGNKVKMLAKDLAGPAPDFYWVKLYKNGIYYNQPQNLQVVSFGFNNESDGQYFNPQIWKANTPEGIDVCRTGDVVRVEILGISRETFDFLSLGVKMSSNGGMFAVTPVNLPTNIRHQDPNTPDAVGFFSVSEVHSKEVVCP